MTPIYVTCKGKKGSNSLLGIPTNKFLFDGKVLANKLLPFVKEQLVNDGQARSFSLCLTNR